MLGSSHQHQEESHLYGDLSGRRPPTGVLAGHHYQQMRLSNSYTPPSIYLRQLLLTCAQSISQSDFSTAHRITTVLSTNSSPSGDSSERLIHSFTKALSFRLSRLHLRTPLLSPPNNYNDSMLQSSYLSLNQITPFIRFCQLTANQAILEAIEDQSNLNLNHHPRDIHILDFDIMHGVQWPPLMQAIAAISDNRSSTTLRITATGENIDILHKTGNRLTKFAHSVGLKFQFFPILLHKNNNSSFVDDLINQISIISYNLSFLPNEILAVNCVLYFHRMLFDRDKLILLLKKIKSLNPKVVTLAEKEANHNHPIFLSRFEEALNYYTAIFDSLEATLPPNSKERMEVEQVWFGREIEDIVTSEGEMRRERHERFLSWEMMMKIGGFKNIGLSPFALSQAKMLLRLHYPSEGYNLEVVNDSFFLGWQNQQLFSVSSWQ